jgi:hypothetical protein
MIDYLKENNVETENVATAFPNNMKQKYLLLNGSEEKHSELNLDKNKYVLYSNIYNDFSDEQIDRLSNDFILEKEMKKRGVFIRLYRNPEIVE